MRVKGGDGSCDCELRAGEWIDPDGPSVKVLDYGNGAYEASYVIRSAGPYEVALVLAGEELVMKGHCEPGKAVVAGCALLGDAVLDLEVGLVV